MRHGRNKKAKIMSVYNYELEFKDGTKKEATGRVHVVLIEGGSRRFFFDDRPEHLVDWIGRVNEWYGVSLTSMAQVHAFLKDKGGSLKEFSRYYAIEKLPELKKFKVIKDKTYRGKTFQEKWDNNFKKQATKIKK